MGSNCGQVEKIPAPVEENEGMSAVVVSHPRAKNKGARMGHGRLFLLVRRFVRYRSKRSVPGVDDLAKPQDFLDT